MRVAARQMRINPHDVIGRRRPPVSIRNADVPRALPAAGKELGADVKAKAIRRSISIASPPPPPTKVQDRLII